MSGTKRKSLIRHQTDGEHDLARAFGPSSAWKRFHKVVFEGGFPLPVYIRVDQRPDTGEIVCSGLMIGVAPGSVVRAEDLRLPLAQTLSQMKRVLELIGSRRGPDGRVITGLAAWTEGAVPPAAHIRPGARGRGVDFYRDLAARYRKAMRVQPAAPTKLLLAEYRVEDSKMRYWLHEARKRGILGRSEKGKAGEVRATRAKRGRP
jgi:hypothetical protein